MTYFGIAFILHQASLHYIRTFMHLIWSWHIWILFMHYALTMYKLHTNESLILNHSASHACHLHFTCVRRSSNLFISSALSTQASPIFIGWRTSKSNFHWQTRLILLSIWYQGRAVDDHFLFSLLYLSKWIDLQCERLNKIHFVLSIDL